MAVGSIIELTSRENASSSPLGSGTLRTARTSIYTMTARKSHLPFSLFFCNVLLFSADESSIKPTRVDQGVIQLQQRIKQRRCNVHNLSVVLLSCCNFLITVICISRFLIHMTYIMCCWNSNKSRGNRFADRSPTFFCNMGLFVVALINGIYSIALTCLFACLML